MAAPIAQTEDDWDTFTDFNSSQSIDKTCLDDNGNKDSAGGEDMENLITDSGMVSYKSVEDLVHTFDERLASCFRLGLCENDGSSISESEVSGLQMPKTFDVGELKNNAIWRQLTDNYGLVQPLDWENSTVRKLHLPALKLRCITSDEPMENINETELKKQLDFHRMVEYNVYSEPVPLFYSSQAGEIAGGIPPMQTADEVIREIEEMMKSANDADAAVDLEVQDTTGIVFDHLHGDESIEEESELNDSFEIYLPEMKDDNEVEGDEKLTSKSAELEQLSLAELNKHYDQVNDKIRIFSSQLLSDLGKRDELKYEIETKKLFISRVVEVQYAQEKFQKDYNSGGKFKRSTTMDSIPKAGLYLTTVIPYNRHPKPTIEDLLVLIKILEAIKNDSDEVPNLLTSYILNVICPAPSENELRL